MNRIDPEVFAPPPDTAPGVPAVEILSAQKTYPNGTQALLPVDMRIAEGEFVTLLGPSGCGKSTLLKMVAGMLEPTDGRLLVWRKPVQQIEQTGRKMAFVFQAPTLMPWASVQTNVRLPLDLAGVPRKEGDARVAEATAEHQAIVLVNAPAARRWFEGSLAVESRLAAFGPRTIEQARAAGLARAGRPSSHSRFPPARPGRPAPSG